jgi:hypothetical protein
MTRPSALKSSFALQLHGRFLWLTLVLAACAAHARAPAPPRKTLTAEEVRQTLIGQAITDGYHWRYLLKPDGSIDAQEMGRPRRGHWHFKGNRLCIAITAGAAPNECWDVMREGKGLVLGIHGNPIYDIQITAPHR